MDQIKVLRAISEREGDTKGRLVTGSFDVMCAFGRSGLTNQKTEGDGATPIGSWQLRELFFRPDKSEPPETQLPTRSIGADSGWCDAPDHQDYNQLVALPFKASHEKLWRDDHLYDLMIPLGYNDQQIVPGKGSAIFFHLAKHDYQPTEGCVAIAEHHMRTLLPMLTENTVLKIQVGL